MSNTELAATLGYPDIEKGRKIISAMRKGEAGIAPAYCLGDLAGDHSRMNCQTGLPRTTSHSADQIGAKV